MNTGIGGRAAETVGRRSKQLAASSQALWAATVQELEGAARTREIGRMLSGERLTQEALKHAEQLLKTGAGAS